LNSKDDTKDYRRYSGFIGYTTKINSPPKSTIFDAITSFDDDDMADFQEPLKIKESKKKKE